MRQLSRWAAARRAESWDALRGGANGRDRRPWLEVEVEEAAVEAAVQLAAQQQPSRMQRARALRAAEERRGWRMGAPARTLASGWARAEKRDCRSRYDEMWLDPAPCVLDWAHRCLWWSTVPRSWRELAQPLALAPTPAEVSAAATTPVSRILRWVLASQLAPCAGPALTPHQRRSRPPTPCPGWQ